ncbi:hypothetical protein [Sphingosinicella terrae]|uniref:hypothetical protein n=1 Tax=Sphingosinicella terrae TaxID=2172047 RepID=UPI000E0D6129|nr:hypothetical protein [Sphingosinicella terrae]
MKIIPVWILGLAAFVTAPARAQGADEWLYQSPLPELVVGFQREQGGTSIVERIPPGETVQDWSQMVTTQRFAGAIARGVSLDQWVNGFVSGLANACPGARTSAPLFSRHPDHREVAFRVDCPLNPATAKPETFLLRAFASAADLHVLQVAFRHVPSAAEAGWAERHLESAVLCDAASSDSPCRDTERPGR